MELTTKDPRNYIYMIGFPILNLSFIPLAHFLWLIRGLLWVADRMDNEITDDTTVEFVYIVCWKAELKCIVNF